MPDVRATMGWVWRVRDEGMLRPVGRLSEGKAVQYNWITHIYGVECSEERLF